jgi:hypothetical protein
MNSHVDRRLQLERVLIYTSILVRENDELLFSQRCVDERGARFVADAFKQDLLTQRAAAILFFRLGS